MYLLDTNVISELRRAGSPNTISKVDKNVLNWAKAVSASQQYLSVITIMEIEAGVLLKERKDSNQGKIFRTWLDRHVLLAFNNRILPVDINVSRCCARLNVPDPRPYRDGLIAATAITHGMTVVTRNVDDFIPAGANTLNPWDYD